jgi:nucleoside-diphosphate-sugar epimerase
MRVLVLGAGGFIGRRVIAALATTDWATPVAAVHRAPATPIGSGVECIRIDATDPTALRSAIAGAAGVVNCVTGDARTILEGTRELLAAAAASPDAPRVVHLSSLAAYGSATGVLDESAPLLGDLGPYSAAKAAAEKLTSLARNTVVFRPGIVYGPHSARWSDELGRLLLARRIGNLGEGGNGFCNLVYVDDVAAAILLALRIPAAAGQAFNLSAPQPPTWNEYLTRYAAVLGGAPVGSMSRIRLYMEMAMVAPAVRILEMGGRLLRRDLTDAIAVVRPSLIKACRHAIILDSRKAEQLLGLRWTPLDAGLRATAAWFASDRTT